MKTEEMARRLAENLIERFYKTHWLKRIFFSGMLKRQAKRNALMCCEEILSAIEPFNVPRKSHYRVSSDLDHGGHIGDYWDGWHLWHSVKEEIEKFIK